MRMAMVQQTSDVGLLLLGTLCPLALDLMIFGY